jgi:thioredoxin-like negative regulator of GroEL
MMMKLTNFFLVTLMATSVASHGAPSGDHSEADTIEPSDSKVHVLTYRNFDRFVKRNPLILMEFYAPWCGHCQELAPQYRAAASKLAKADLPIPVVLAKMNDGDEANRRLRAGAPEMFNYSSYPSLFVIKDGKYGGGFPSMGNETRCKELGYCGEHEWYGGGRVADEIVFHMSAVARGLDPYDEEKKTRPGLYKLDDDYDERIIRDLVPEEFDEIVMQDTEYTWIVEFYSDRCPFCKSLAPEMKKASKMTEEVIPGKTRFGAVNSRVYEDMAERFGITGWPWVTSFHLGEKVEDMAGLGGAQSVVNWAQKMVEKTNPKGGVSRLSDEFVSRPPWSPDGAAAPEEGGDGSCGLVKEECAGGSTESWSDLSKRAISFNVLSNADLTTRQSSIDLGTSDEEKEKKTLLAELKPIDDAIAAAAAQAAGSGSGATGSSSMTAVDVAKMIGAVASRYPQNPTRAHKTTARALVAGLGQHAPCGEGCRHLLQQSLRNVRVGAPRVKNKVTFLKWACAFVNHVSGESTPMDCKDSALQRIHFPIPKEEEKDTSDGMESSGPWDALIYMKDPSALMQIKSSAEAWESQDYEELESLALEYNLASEKALAQMRSKITKGQADQSDQVKKLTRRLGPVLALKDEIKKLQAEIQAATKK